MKKMITEKPYTRGSIAEEARALGVQPGMVLLVHSSMKAIGGWIAGGAEAVVLGLEDALGDDGTLVMPTQSSDLTDPAIWMNPPLDPLWWDLVRDEMPLYDPDLSATRGMGAVPETFRKQRGTRRSPHPHLSFAARGPEVEGIVGRHPLDYGLGEDSPLGRLYERDARVLMLGTGYDTNTSFHLGEYRSAYRGKKELRPKAKVMGANGPEWVRFGDINFDSEDFARLGGDFETERSAHIRRGRIGRADCRLVPQRVMVDYAARWLELYR
ncbi:AAC(3) family N-acetyltransferase [Saccharibacillus sp. CPCC 101409]|uniref:aminoglycoside N(3)-acetyltransferase n=1 Tax=Saccharibacillus sp. CPCC 101409 TaxID=3058041 RepID=UPI002672A742|nr:AAC(3) family N-acetyltransferase [Saccharibacillus sp. CPCC 101409]MDO3411049.1 AAC(3) family N-acetyltransferase [Saccharibacillus sp. CPCC 101409]